MKYLYYSLHQFYKKIIRVERSYPPIVDITGVIAVLETFVFFTIVNTLFYLQMGERFISNYPLIFTAFFVLLYWLNYQYFKIKEECIIQELDTYSTRKKILMYIVTLSIIILLVWGYLFDGFYDFL